MSDIKQNFTSDVSKLENDLNKLQGQYLKLKEGMTAATQAAKAGGQDASTALGGAGQAATEFAEKLGGIATAAISVKSAYSSWTAEMDRVAEKGAKLHADMLSGLTKIGATQEVGKVKEWIAHTVRGGVMPVTREQMEAAYVGAAGAMPQSTTERKQEVAFQAGRAAPILGETGDVQHFGEEVGRMAEFMPKTSAKNLASLVMSLRQRTGREAEQLTSRQFLGGVRALDETGATDSEGALAIGVVALQKQMSATILERIAAKVAEPMQEKVGATGARPSPEQEVHNRFARAGKAERLQMIMTDEAVQEAVLGSRLAGRMGRITPEEVAKQTAGLKADEQKDLLGGMLATPDAKKAAVGAELSRRNDVLDLRTESAAKARALEEKVYQTEKRESGMGWIGRGVMDIGHQTGRIAGSIPGAFLSEAEQGNYDASVKGYRTRAMQAARPASGEGETKAGRTIDLRGSSDATGDLFKAMDRRLESIDRNLRSNQATNAATAARAQKE